MDAAMDIEIWSDVVCPWCYLGKRRFEHALDGFEHRDQVRVVHRAFQLDPTMPKGETRDQQAMLVEKYGAAADQIVASQAELARLGAIEGIDYHFEGGLAGNTFDAHRLIRLGLERGVQDAVVERFFRAHFTDQRSLFDPESLAELAGEAGLDAGEARAVLKEDTYADAVEADIRQAREYGANGVPFFVIDSRYGISGAQPTATFGGALGQAWADSPHRH
jgi:predicted DsbA family dithiol-disulfide isomerase